MLHLPPGIGLSRSQPGPPPPAPDPPSGPPTAFLPEPGFSFPVLVYLLLRLAAWILDWMVLNVIVVIVLEALNALLQLTTGVALDPSRSTSQTVFLYVIAQLVTLAYYTYYWSVEGGGQTIGNRLLRIRVTRPGGEPASRLRALARAAIMYVSIYLLLAGVVISLVTILVTPRRQALHDLLCDTEMVRVGR